MNYSKIYETLIERARVRINSEYVEYHHIIPKCMGGTDDSSNLVALTPEEHFLSHQLLARIYKDTSFYHKLIYACHMMTIKTSATDRRNLSKLKRFGWIRREYASACSARMKGKVFSFEHRLNLSKALTGKQKTTEALQAAKAAGAKRKGEKHTLETKQKMSISRSARLNEIQHTQEAKDKISKAKAGVPWSEARRLAQTKIKQNKKI